ncbi:MAG: hypothetical protein KF773_34385 [Deltaproteobacteria bacterium]|nr:hypothetical protein [Deltaproteobacteria bacterium]MCW5805216.1 hypothetical protein [Deltaproteobacteria bacterium]
MPDLTSILLELGVDDPEQLWLDVHDVHSPLERTTRYVVHAPAAKMTVERSIAAQLRVDGAVWAGDVRRDPIAVA